MEAIEAVQVRGRVAGVVAAVVGARLCESVQQDAPMWHRKPSTPAPHALHLLLLL